MREETTDHVSGPGLLGGDLPVILGANVERLRKALGITKVRFAAMVDIGRPTLDRIEHGIHDPRLSLISKLAEALEVDEIELLTPPRVLRDRAGQPL